MTEIFKKKRIKKRKAFFIFSLYIEQNNYLIKF